MELNQAPVTLRENIVDDYFGVKVADPYRWLEDENSENTKKWVDSQISYTSEFLNKIPFREKIRNRLTELINYEKFGTPFIKSGKTYIYKNDGLQNQSVLYELDGSGNESKVVIDPNKFSKDGTVSLSGLSFNKSGDKLAYMVAASGTDWNTCFVLDTKTGIKFEDSIKWIKFSGIAWYGNGFFYSRYPDSQGGKVSTENQNHRLYYHRLGTSQSKDEVWFEDPANPKRNVYAITSEDQRFLVLTQTESTTGNSFNFINLGSGSRQLVSVVKDFEKDYNFIDNYDNQLFVLTTSDAPNKRLISIDASNPSKAFWKTIIPETSQPIESVEILDKKIFVTYLKNAYSQIKIYDLTGNFIQDLELPVIGTVSGISGENLSPFAYFSLSSFLFPSTVFKLNLKTLKYEPFKASKLDFDPEKYITVQKWYKSKDGTKVPMFITHKKDLKLDGNNPALLYGYGGFSISVTPSFSASRLLFLEKGGIYCVANIRGGGEFGEDWHLAGTLDKKQNVFNDFIAAAEYLIREKYTSPSKLAIEGGSNGGLLVGACMLQRPDLFGVVYPRVGVLDMLRYHKFTIGWAWATDYGKSDDKDAFKYLVKYSPVHNVIKRAYPATLVMTADHDDRVVPAHSFKFISELQLNQTGKKPVMIRIDKKAGHGAGKPLTKVIDEMTDFYSFMFFNMGIDY
ncbi:MAG: prolyl oligopeptidase family serine peptidase [Deltaproteobacteria bacterium]